MAKRFTFADAKLKIKELESKVEELEGVLKDEFNNAQDDIVEDFKKVGYGDIIFGLIGIAIGFILGAVFV